MLSDKAMRILKVLALNNGSMMTVKMLGVCLDMSERSVSMYLKEVNEFCRIHQIAYISKRGVGICLDLPDPEADILKKFTEPSYYDVEYRVHYILEVLLDGWESYTAAMFAEELYTSKYVISGDLDLAEAWLENYGLTLRRKLKNGIALEGEELNLRSAIVAVKRMAVYPEQEGRENIEDCRLDPQTLDRLLSCYGKTLTAQVAAAIQKFEELLGTSFVDYSFVMLAEYLCLQQKRLREGREAQEDMEAVCQVPPHDCVEKARLFVKILEAAGGIPLPRGEQAYVSILLAGAEPQQSGRDHVESHGQHGQNGGEQGHGRCPARRGRIGRINHEILSYIAQVTGLKLDEDRELEAGMEAFLCGCVVRTRYRLDIRNPFLEDIKKNYGVIFTACFSLCSLLKRECGRLPSEHEVAFMTLLIGGALVRAEKKVNAVLVGAGGLLLAQMLAAKIEQAVPGLRVIAVLSMDTVYRLQQLEYDLVITTVTGHALDGPAVCVTPVLGERDIIRLQKALNDRYAEKLGIAERVNLKDYINPGLVMLDVEAGSKEKLIGMACEVLERGGYVTGNYQKEVLLREEISSTEVGNGVAIPHGIENTVRRPAVLMMRLKNKMDWGSDSVDIVFMLALNFDDITVTRKFFKLFYEKAGDHETAERLRRARTKDEVLRILS